MPRLVPALALLVLLAATPAVPAALGQEGGVRKAHHDTILDAVAASDARLTVLNVWATWCAPCVEEFPAFVRLRDELGDQGVEVLFVSADFEDEIGAVQVFLDEQGWSEPSYLRVGRDHEFVQRMSPDWSGALPATFVYDADGRLVDFWEGAVDSYDDLLGRVEARLPAVTGSE